ncbi:MAG: carbohydrate ABC transporter permease [Caldilineaceae bacterium SB0665_bin_21]|nr:carbohydrate ABC transporter permease [Caldilineaceae bacterium SB0665_bin_21]MYC62735.1 carbohydrate ABC transporter permease [Caldilineaceae bacterium SB0661_bin_34]
MGTRTMPAGASLRRQARIHRVWLYAVLVLGAVMLTTPFLWMTTSSLKDEAHIWLYPPQWIPNPLHWQNYTRAMQEHPFHLFFRNTLILVVVGEIATVGSASICGYGFAKFRFPGRELLFGFALATLMLPQIVLLIPQFIIFRYLGWIDTYWPLLVPLFFGGNAFFVFLFRQFFRTIPDELCEAAKMDGCSELGIYGRIVLPLSKPVLTTAVIFTFVGTWNDFMGPLIYINTPAKKTLALGLAHFKGYYGTQWHLLMAASVVVTVPVLIVFFAAQRYFVQGIAFSGLKG